MNLKSLITKLADQGYKSHRTFVVDTQILFIELVSILQRKQFLVRIPSSTIIHTSDPNFLLELSEMDYKTFRQKEYLEKINLDSVACVSNNNISIKLDSVLTCYTIVNPDIEDLSGDLEDDVEEEESISDIEIDDYPIKDIIPVINLEDLHDHIEDDILQSYRSITEAEEEMNEREVERLLRTFDKQKETIRSTIYNVHRDAFNTRRDIEKAGGNLERIYKLKAKSIDEKDRVRFQIERLATETELDIDKLNKQLREQRNSANDLLQKYQSFIERFDYLH